MGARLVPGRPLHIAKLGVGIRKGLPRAMRSVGALVAKETRRNLQNRVLHRQSGELQDSVGWGTKKIPGGVRAITFAGGGKVAYARIHEKGGWTGRNYATKIPKRPYMTKAWVAQKPRIRQLMHHFLARITRAS